VKFRFGAFVLDCDRRQLLRGTDDVHLSPKAFDLLRALIDSRPNAISKQALQERVWPVTFVSEANLPLLIAEIRKAVDESSRDPRFIRTVHRFGYAFSGEVIEVAEAASRGRVASRCWLMRGTRKYPLTEGLNVLGRDPTARCASSRQGCRGVTQRFE
jgi:DNA-binding winged helix-turn-helix (wHTH) protein